MENITIKAPDLTNNSYTLNKEPPKQQKKDIFGPIPEIPTQEAVDGIKFDFNDGLRVLIPQGDKSYRITFIDADTDLILYNNVVPPGAMVTSVKKFYVRFKLLIYTQDGTEPIFQHTFDCTDKDVLIQLPVGTLGDSIAWFSYVERFQLKHKCRLTCAMFKDVADIVKNQYKQIKFIVPDETKDLKPYASYKLGLFFLGNVDNQPVDFRYIGLHRTAGCILGVDMEEIPPRFDLSAPRQIQENYAVIATQASSQAKFWNNPLGWDVVIRFLRDNGYKVVCIDKERVHGTGLVYNHMPWGVEDYTGALPLQERINIIKDADFFIGLSSGLSWLAWGCKVPVVMISGFTHPLNEFSTPYRVISYHACNSCWNDMRENFDHFDFLWCPRHKGTDKQFECTRMITPQQVINTIKTIPSFKLLQK